MTDFSKAFDLVNHTVLINKIIEMGVNRNIIPWICDFLHHRQQCVRFNDDRSEFVYLNAGVPQGTKLGPIGFQIIINDAASGSTSQYWKYVDDLTFAENMKMGESGKLQVDLDDFTTWSKNNHLKLNPSKCQALEICFSKSAPLHTDLMIGNEKLSYVNKAKVLGIWLQSDLKWDTQIDNMVKKANKKLFMLRSLKKFGFDQDELITVYKSYVRPVIEYCDVVWHSGLSNNQINDLERIQKRACRTMLGFNYKILF